MTREPRLYLRQPTEEDARQLLRWLDDKGHQKGYFGTDVDPSEWMEDYASLAPSMDRLRMFAGVTKDADAVVAFANFKPGYPVPWVWDCEIIIDPKAVNSGYGFEALALGIDEIFSTEPAIKLAGPVISSNERSYRLAEKLGFVREGTLRQHLLQEDGSAKDAYLYGLLKSEWRSPFTSSTDGADQ